MREGHQQAEFGAEKKEPVAGSMFQIGDRIRTEDRPADSTELARLMRKFDKKRPARTRKVRTKWL